MLAEPTLFSYLHVRKSGRAERCGVVGICTLAYLKCDRIEATSWTLAKGPKPLVFYSSRKERKPESFSECYNELLLVNFVPDDREFIVILPTFEATPRVTVRTLSRCPSSGEQMAFNYPQFE